MLRSAAGTLAAPSGAWFRVLAPLAAATRRPPAAKGWSVGVRNITGSGTAPHRMVPVRARATPRKHARSRRGRKAMVPKVVRFGDYIAISDLAHDMGFSVDEVVEIALEMGMKNALLGRVGDMPLSSSGATLKGADVLSADDAELLVLHFGLDPLRLHSGPATESLPSQNLSARLVRLNQLREQRRNDLGVKFRRPPVVAVMGHIDHGKTTLLDVLTGTPHPEAALEAGGITQRLRLCTVRALATTADLADLADSLEDGAPVARKAKRKDSRISGKAAIHSALSLVPPGCVTFVDTPGHAAFATMRCRGASVTDMALLVIAVDDGVMSQTKEVIHALRKEEERVGHRIPMVVAMTKMDKVDGGRKARDAQVAKVTTQLTSMGIVAESLGGDVQVVPVSAKTGEGLNELREALALQAELLTEMLGGDEDVLEVSVEGAATGVVVDAWTARGAGPVAAILLQWGRLDIGDVILSGGAWGKVRALFDMSTHPKERVVAAVPGMAVEVTGFRNLPLAGNTFTVLADERTARDEAEKVEARASSTDYLRQTVEQKWVREAGIKSLDVVVKAGAQGALEAVVSSLAGLRNAEVGVNVLSAAVGPVTDSDIDRVTKLGGIVIAFDSQGAGQKDVPHPSVCSHSIIYRVVDDVVTRLSALMTPECVEQPVGNAEVLQMFTITGPKGVAQMVAGCRVTQGQVQRSAEVLFRVTRGNVVLADDLRVESLRHFKEAVTTVSKGNECGIRLVLANGTEWTDVVSGDVLSGYKRTFRARTFTPTGGGFTDWVT